MKKKVMEKWVKALRSGRYKQGRHALKYKTKAGVVRHCCLGVLCDLYQKEHKVKLRTDLNPGKDELKSCKVFLFDDNEAGLPDQVMKWSGISSDDGVLYMDTQTLASMNDYGSDFNKIADIIEEEYKEL